MSYSMAEQKLKMDQDMEFWEEFLRPGLRKIHKENEPRLLPKVGIRTLLKKALCATIGILCLFVSLQTFLLAILPVYSDTERIIGLVATLILLIIVIQKPIRVPMWQMYLGKL